MLNGHDTSFEDLTILLKESNKFKLYLKKSLLITREKAELNKNIYSYALEHFYRLLSKFALYFLHIHFGYSYNFHDIFSIVDSSSLLFENASDERRK